MALMTHMATLAVLALLALLLKDAKSATVPRVRELALLDGTTETRTHTRERRAGDERPGHTVPAHQEDERRMRTPPIRKCAAEGCTTLTGLEYCSGTGA